MDENWVDIDENGWLWVDVHKTKKGFESGLVLKPPKVALHLSGFLHLQNLKYDNSCKLSHILTSPHILQTSDKN